MHSSKSSMLMCTSHCIPPAFIQCRQYPTIIVTQINTYHGTISVNNFVQLHASAERLAAHVSWIILNNHIYYTPYSLWMICGPWLYHCEHSLHVHITEQDMQHELIMSGHVDSNLLDTMMCTVTMISYTQWKSSLQEQAYYVCKLLHMHSKQVHRIDFDAYLLQIVDIPGCLPCQGVPLLGWSAAQFYGMLVFKWLFHSLGVNCKPFITCWIQMSLAKFSQMCVDSSLDFCWHAQAGRLSIQVQVLWYLDFLLVSSEAQYMTGWLYCVHTTGTIIQIYMQWQPIQLYYHMIFQMLHITFPTLVISDVRVV